MTEEPKKIKIQAVKTPDFKVMIADGAYTWFGTGGGIITFFYDTLEPEIKEDGGISINLIKRTFPIEIRMNPELYKNLISWMGDQVRICEESTKKEKK